MKTTFVIVLTLALLMVSGCSLFDDDDDNDPLVTNGNSDPDEPSPPAPSLLEQFASQSTNSEAMPITDATALKTGIDAAFGDANGMPLELQTGESLDSIIKRASGS